MKATEATMAYETGLVTGTPSATAEDDSRRLQDRILGALPLTQQAFSKLLGLLSIEASERVPTACVTSGARSRLLVNPNFVARHCRTDEHLAMLVMHELYHVLLGHTRLYPRVTPAQNWAFDCLINAQLCRLFPEPRYLSFFWQFTRDAKGPARLLGPPERWNPFMSNQPTGASRWENPASGSLLLEELHWRLYSDESVTVAELFLLLESAGAGEIGDEPGEGSAQRRSDDLGSLPLLGNHGEDDAADGRDPSCTLHPEVLREVRDIVARWPMLEVRSGRDQGADVRQYTVTLAERRRQTVAVLRRAVASVADAGHGLARRHALAAQPVRAPVDAGRDRRAWLQRLLGAEPLLFDAEVPARVATPVERVRVYLDVSGSMEAVLPALYAALLGCGDSVEPTVNGFSTAVAELSLAQLRRGLAFSTGGTDIACVATDMLRDRVRRALIVTDGWVGDLSARDVKALRERRVRVAVALTPSGDASFARRMGWPLFLLPR
jgi:hypothetical protein